MKKIIFLFCTLQLQALCQSVPNTNIYGVFEHSQKYYYDGSSLKSNNSVFCIFSFTPVKKIDSAHAQNVTWVEYNAIRLKNNPVDRFYSKFERTDPLVSHSDSDSTDLECNSMGFTTKQWTIKGKDSIPDMNFIYTGAMPSFSINAALLYDTLYKSDTLHLTLEDIHDCDSIRVVFADSDTSSTRHYAEFLTANYSGRNYYYIPSGVFSGLSVGPRGFVTIQAIRYTYQVVSGRNYLFRSVFSLMRPNVYIKP